MQKAHLFDIEDFLNNEYKNLNTKMYRLKNKSSWVKIDG